VRIKRIPDASRIFFNVYLATLISIFARPQILPHLELLDWEDKIIIPWPFLENLARSSIKHPKLYGVEIDEEFKIEPHNMLTSGGCLLLAMLADI
jgi:hypothetical protein